MRGHQNTHGSGPTLLKKMGNTSQGRHAEAPPLKYHMELKEAAANLIAAAGRPLDGSKPSNGSTTRAWQGVGLGQTIVVLRTNFGGIKQHAKPPNLDDLQ